MSNITGVKFKGTEKIYFFSKNDLDLLYGEKVIVETERGMQIATVEIVDVQDDNKIPQKLNDIIRKATDKDLFQEEKNKNDALVCLKKSRDLVESLKLKMQVIDAEYSYDRRQLTFHFLADNRIDFRELVKLLANEYKTRIELRQIGVRDKAKQVGGIGHCGQSLCCSRFLTELDNVSINMAKNQNLALNPNKINGVCGRLLCCLKYEDDQYKDCRKCLPKINSYIETERGMGKVINIDILKKEYSVLLKNNEIIRVIDDKKGCC